MSTEDLIILLAIVFLLGFASGLTVAIQEVKKLVNKRD